MSLVRFRRVMIRVHGIVRMMNFDSAWDADASWE